MSECLGLRERKKLRTRETIVGEALRLFAERGFAATTVADIAAAADIAPRTFFAYFPSKEDVVFADFEATCAGLEARLAARAPGESAIDALRAWITGMLEAIDLDAKIHLERNRLLEENESLAAHDRHLATRIERLIAAAVARDLDDAPDALRPRLVAAAAIAALRSLRDGPDGGDEAGKAPMETIDEALVFLRGGMAALHAQSG